MEDKMILGAWRVRVIFHGIRYLLEYLKIPYEEKIYDHDKPQKWFEDKKNLGLDFPNLPYLIHGNVRITETKAILQYIIAKSGNQEFGGKTLIDKCTIETIHCHTHEIGNLLYILYHMPKECRREKKNETFVKIVKKMGEFSAKLGDKEWMLGYLSMADLLFVHIIEWITEIQPKILEIKSFQNLKNLVNRFYELEPIKKFREKTEYPHFITERFRL